MVSPKAKASEGGKMKIIISSFGYKFGKPLDADLLLDARTLRNPFSDMKLRKQTGLDEDVYKFVIGDRRWGRWRAAAEFEASKTVEAAAVAGLEGVVIGVGCTGGRHRSVVATLALARFFYWQGAGVTFDTLPGRNQVMVGHRDLVKEGVVMGELRNIKDILAKLPAPSNKKVPWG